MRLGAFLGPIADPAQAIGRGFMITDPLVALTVAATATDSVEISAGVERAASHYDGWIASGAYRSPDEVIDALGRYRAAGGGRAIVSTIQLGPETDLGGMKETLERYAEAGFDDAVVMLMPGGPSVSEARGLVS